MLAAVHFEHHPRSQEETRANHQSHFSFPRSASELETRSRFPAPARPHKLVRGGVKDQSRASQRLLPRSPISFALTHSARARSGRRWGFSGRFALKLSFSRKRADDPAVAA
jgi:hypothetical protein